MHTDIIRLTTGVRSSLLIVQVVLLFLAREQRHENIMAALSINQSDSSEEYVSAEASFESALIASVVTLSLTALIFLLWCNISNLCIALTCMVYLVYGRMPVYVPVQYLSQLVHPGHLAPFPPLAHLHSAHSAGAVALRAVLPDESPPHPPYQTILTHTMYNHQWIAS